MEHLKKMANINHVVDRKDRNVRIPNVSPSLKLEKCHPDKSVQRLLVKELLGIQEVNLLMLELLRKNAEDKRGKVSGGC